MVSPPEASKEERAASRRGKGGDTAGVAKRGAKRHCAIVTGSRQGVVSRRSNAGAGGMRGSACWGKRPGKGMRVAALATAALLVRRRGSCPKFGVPDRAVAVRALPVDPRRCLWIRRH